MARKSAKRQRYLEKLAELLDQKPKGKPLVKTGRKADARGKWIGKTFGRLTITKFLSPKRVQAICSCGILWEGRKTNILYGNTRSCGCLSKEIRHYTSRTHGHKAGGKVSKLYAAWQAMKTRCYGHLPVNKPYILKGIKVCSRWLEGTQEKSGYEWFAQDVGEPPTRLHTLERIDNNGNYEPSNVRWATRKEQGNNKSNNRMLTAFGLTLTLPQWVDKNGLTQSALRFRLRRGWPLETALTTPLKCPASIT